MPTPLPSTPFAQAPSAFCLAPFNSVANQVVARLTAAGFPEHDISLLAPDTRDAAEGAPELRQGPAEGTTVGLVEGGVVGDILGLRQCVGLLLIPGLGGFIAAGPVMTALIGSNAEAAPGPIAGVLMGMGVPEAAALRCQQKVRNGNILLSARAEDPAGVARAQEIFLSAGAVIIRPDSAEPAPPRRGRV